MTARRPSEITPKGVAIFAETSRPGTHLISLRSRGESLDQFLKTVKMFLEDNPSYKLFGEWADVSTLVGIEGEEHYVAFIKIG